MTGTATRVGVIFRPSLPPERLAAYVAAVEAVGLDDLWLWEDCFQEGGLSSATAALAWSRSLRVGVGLLPVPLRNPALAAMEIATVDRLFPGRFVPAVGHGVLAWMDQVGAGAASPMALLREWVTATRSLLHGETVTTNGDYVRLEAVTLDWPPTAAPPLLVGARGPKTVALAGELADGMVLDVPITPDGVRRAVETAASRRPHEVVVYLESAGMKAAELSETMAGYVDSGATTVVVQPAVDDTDVEATIQLAGQARDALHRSL
jgi:alkanesulfonate monooxygenase SsuD/methylene tetrahydromethanopterin reductase-like flavin-dependent oxidoreductase (luciferase family)